MSKILTIHPLQIVGMTLQGPAGVNLINIIPLFFMTFALIEPTFAQPTMVNSERVQFLLQQNHSYNQDGPNCLSSILFAKGFIDDAAYIDSSFVEALISTKHCSKLPALNSLEKGDLVLLGGKFGQDNGTWGHGILFLGEGSVFAKMGFKKEDETQVTSLLENIRFYLAQDSSKAGKLCTQSFQDKSKEAWCRNHSVFPSYYRCDLVAARTEIERSGLSQIWQRILTLRKGLYQETLRESKVDHSNLSEELDLLEGLVEKSREPGHLRQTILSLIQSTRDQIHLIDAFIVY